MERIFQPQGIIKTLPGSFFENYLRGGLQGFEKDFMRLNNESWKYYYWIFNLSGKPKYEILYFYLLFDGAVRYRANIINYGLPNRTIKCADGTTQHGRIWVYVSAPIIKAANPIPMKGFQGFRYTELLF